MMWLYDDAFSFKILNNSQYGMSLLAELSVKICYFQRPLEVSSLPHNLKLATLSNRIGAWEIV